MHVFRWDLDRTYLDTDIHSISGLVRTALERPEDKRNIPGSSALMRSLHSHDPSARTHLISGSPRQMRKVIEAKLKLDDVVVQKLTLKDNLGNLKRGRLRAVRGQVGYKLPELLRHRIGLGPATSETLFGDDNEQDALIYALYDACLTRQIQPDPLIRVLEACGAYPDAIRSVKDSLRSLPPGPPVEDAFILLDQRTPPQRFHGLGARIRPVYSWAQAALILHARGRLSAEAWVRVAEACCSPELPLALVLPGWAQDTIRRALLEREQLLALLEEAPLSTALQARVQRAVLRAGPLPTSSDAPLFDPMAWLRAHT